MIKNQRVRGALNFCMENKINKIEKSNKIDSKNRNRLHIEMVEMDFHSGFKFETAKKFWADKKILSVGF